MNLTSTFPDKSIRYIRFSFHISPSIPALSTEGAIELSASEVPLLLTLNAGDIGNYYYGQGHPMKPHRIRMTHNLLLNYRLYRKMEIYVSLGHQLCGDTEVFTSP